MNLPEGVEVAMVIGVDDEGYLHLLSRLDTQEAVMLLEDAIDIIIEDTPDNFILQ